MRLSTPKRNAMKKATDANFLSRAMAAYFRSGADIQPASDSGVVAHEGRLYVVLRNVNRVLAVYRIRNDGMLKRLIRWPDAIDMPLATC